MGIDNTAAAEQRRRERRALKEEIQTLWAEIDKDPERSNSAWEALIPALERFLPWVDNWAVCDSLNPKALGRNLPLLTPRLRRWLGSEHCYTVRFSILTLMRYYLEEDVFRPEYLLWVAELEREEYYIRMMQAWFLAEALARQYDAALPLIAGGTLPLWVHNKTIQKAVESRKIPDERKSALKALRRRREKN
jgi:3-methyladenine DNA glycosylase AlkD